MNASVGLTAVPSTETVKGQDDFANHSAFQTIDCNFVIDENENKIPTAIKGGKDYSDTGKVDVGVMVPLTYWGIQEFGAYYIVHFATKPHPEINCTIVTPWCNRSLGYGILTKYYAGQIDGILYSSSGNPIYNFVSAKSGHEELQKKGTGYHGSGSERTAYLLCMLWIKYATKNSQSIFLGCTDYDLQYRAHYAGEDTNYITLYSTEANGFYVGSTVSIGDATENLSYRYRGNTWMRNIADKVKITAIEEEEGTTGISRVYVDKEHMNITLNTYISSMPLHSGQTDRVLGVDGYVKNDGKHAFKLGGIEDMVGASFISMNVIWECFNETNTMDCYIRKTAAWSESADGWTATTTIDMDAAAEYWIVGDLDMDFTSGAIWPRTEGTGYSVGVGDQQFITGENGYCTAVMRGSLDKKSKAGLAHMLLALPSNNYWYTALCV